MKQAIGFLCGMVRPWFNIPKGSNKCEISLKYSRVSCVNDNVKDAYPTKEGSTLHSNGTSIGLTDDPLRCSVESLLTKRE
jgi:hypothetical protein